MQLYNYLNNNILIKEKKFALILGETPSQGARSPKLWNKVYKKLNKKIKMYPADISFKNLSKVIKHLKKNNNFLGGSVTMPYKEEIIRYLDNVDNNSKKIGSVNTIIKKKNKLIGFNTDYYGSLDTLKNLKISKSSGILIIGCGGAGKSTIASVLNFFKGYKYFFFNRNTNKLKKFLNKFKDRENINIIRNYNQLLRLNNIGLIINTSSVGFNSWIKKNYKFYNLKFFSPLSKISKIKFIKSKNSKLFQKLNKFQIKKNEKITKNFINNNSSIKIFDIIYNPLATKLMHSNKIKSNNINGLKMNLMQAVKGFMLVNNIKNKKLVFEVMKK
tara:strand:+ start:3325 stop:4314 length:990 start_codon:yes stop_codon:yes gene_type:complete